MTRPIIDWIAVDEKLPPKGQKVQGLSHAGVLIIGDLHDMAKGKCPFIVCWRETPKKPDNWNDLLTRLGW